MSKRVVEVEIAETLYKTIKVEIPDEYAGNVFHYAERKVTRDYKDEEIILYSDDFIGPTQLRSVYGDEIIDWHDM
ncbi:MAG: DpnD/PcfM family protein [Bifidobacteriaceae bacterium]|jgi:hypothetical protein|nr:DpnD/PcfM family protein [Bifidobacteriaceae bacterium]